MKRFIISLSVVGVIAISIVAFHYNWLGVGDFFSFSWLSGASAMDVLLAFGGTFAVLFLAALLILIGFVAVRWLNSRPAAAPGPAAAPAAAARPRRSLVRSLLKSVLFVVLLAAVAVGGAAAYYAYMTGTLPAMPPIPSLYDEGVWATIIFLVTLATFVIVIWTLSGKNRNWRTAFVGGVITLAIGFYVYHLNLNGWSAKKMFGSQASASVPTGTPTPSSVPAATPTGQRQTTSRGTTVPCDEQLYTYGAAEMPIRMYTYQSGSTIHVCGARGWQILTGELTITYQGVGRKRVKPGEEGLIRAPILAFEAATPDASLVVRSSKH